MVATDGEGSFSSCFVRQKTTIWISLQTLKTPHSSFLLVIAGKVLLCEANPISIS
jgi:hypothetical protein